METIQNTLIDKEYWNWMLDHFEAEFKRDVCSNFNKRSSITKRGGRPYLYSPEELGKIMIKYFRNCINNEQPLMITGICLSLGISRMTLYKLEKSSNDEFVYIIKKGKAIVESYLETQCHLRANPYVSIFILKNMGWRS